MSSTDEKIEYRSIFKATAILGSVQLINIIIGVVRNKIVSMLLGPSGMGIVGLLQSSSQTVSGFTNCGVSTSAIKNVAEAYENKNYILLGKVLYVLKRLVACTGTLAIIAMLVLCKKLSQWSFGTEDFAISFACLSLSLLLTQATQAYQTIIKGCRRINYYAKANILGHFFSLVISVPLYYVWGKDAIVPVLILVSASTFFFAFYFEKKIGIKEVIATKEEFKSISTDILKMGIPLAFSEVFPIMASYVIRLHVSGIGGVEDVGFFTAGFTILNGYVGMIFTAMASDYIPRLSAQASDNNACEKTINSQIILSFLILFPILIVLIVLSQFVVWFLYTKDFYPMVGMVCWGALGMMYKTLNWCYGIVLIPKRESKAYFLFSVLSAVFYLVSSILCYNIWSVTGLGISFLLSQAFDFSTGYLYIGHKYKILLKRVVFIYAACFSIVLVALIFANTVIEPNIYIYIIEVIVFVFSSIFAVQRLNKMMNLKEFLKKKLNKNTK